MITMKLPRIFRHKKLRLTAGRRPLRTATSAQYDDMSEPNMKLSRALLVVLLLHVVAVAGIIAFNAIKMRQTAAAASIAPASSITTPSPASSAIARISADAKATPTEPVKRAEPVKPTIDSHKTYVVAKGDNPVTIAKKFKVPYDDLVALNHIDDPRKLRVGQKLLIPNKARVKKTTD